MEHGRQSAREAVRSQGVREAGKREMMMMRDRDLLLRDFSSNMSCGAHLARVGAHDHPSLALT